MVILLMRVTTNMVVRSIVVIRETLDLNKSQKHYMTVWCANSLGT